MEVTFSAKDLATLESDRSSNGGHCEAVVRAYRKLLRIIRDASDERDLRAMKSLRLEKLQGDRSGQYSMRLNDKMRLILEIVETKPKHTIHLIEITNYH